MGNVNPPNKDVHRTYDLKGSSVGRSIEDEKASIIGYHITNLISCNRSNRSPQGYELEEKQGSARSWA